MSSYLFLNLYGKLSYPDVSDIFVTSSLKQYENIFIITILDGN